MTVELIIFGVVCTVLTLLAIAAVITPMWRARPPKAARDTDIAIYRDQLAEVDRDLARGVLDETEAERTRTEISRRVLAADASGRAAGSDAPRGLSRFAATALGLALIGSSAAVYMTIGAPGYGDVPRAERLAIGEQNRANRPLQLEAEAANPQEETLSQFDDETVALIQSRRAAAFEGGDDVETWAVLAQTEAAIGQFQRATRAQERVVALLGDDAGVDDFTRLLDLMVASTRGYVSPEAETVALKILQIDPDSIEALYYAGLMYAQNDRPDRAFALWRRVVENGEPGTLHYNFAAGQIEQVAFQLGMDYVLPDRRGPSEDDIAAAQDMAPEDRQAMIEGMVGQLADRLATEGGPPADWARLISALMVLGDEDTARTVLGEAELVFGGDVQAVQVVRRAAAEAGLEP